MKRKSYPIAGVIVIAIIGFAFFMPQQGEKYSVSPEGIISYANRPAPAYETFLLKDSPGARAERISFTSKGATIYGLLTVPKSLGKVPAFIVLPGATVKKEAEQESLGNDLNELGFATFVIDVRGEGETGGALPSLEQDYGTFSEGGEPVQHKSIHDVLRAYDILKGKKEIDAGRIYMAGISNGGRKAVIAAAIEPSIRGALLIATAGYKFPGQDDEKLDIFLRSINPDNYIGLISPRRLLMLHSPGDTVIPISLAQDTFSRAAEPKKFVEVDASPGFHGYEGTTMKDALVAEIEGWL
ncbi:MAG: acetylxylan esterase [Candidatus Aenigmarchaeota archaeon]|nr:acetylxylan esterase [Candidatus Aenigmarchaeota archaeon]